MRFASLARLAGLAVAGLLTACAATGPHHAARNVGGLRFIGEQRIPLKTQFDGTTVGGISGIDYDAASGSWILASDDRSALAPARFYRAGLQYGATSFDAVTLTGVQFLRQRDGSPYPGVKTRTLSNPEVADVEAVRADPRDGSIWYTSEGDRRLGLDPFVRHAAPDGTLLATLPLPPMFKVWPNEERGARNNVTFEGLSFAPDGASLWVSLESPLYEDGPLPTPERGAVSRITRLARDGTVLAQYAYPVDAIPARPGPGKAADNGISEIAVTGEETLLVLERSAVQGADGKYRNHVRLYEMDVHDASDVRGLPALTGASYVPAAKRLVLDFATLGLPVIDNLEAMSFGPPLPNGHDTLVVMSDDNFNRAQVTQLLLFEVLPR